MANLYTMEAVNLIVGDTGNQAQPGITTHLSIQELKLPGIEENYVDHRAGGAEFAIEISTHINRLEATFNLAGWQPEVMTMIGQALRANQKYTAYGVVRDQKTGRPIQSMAKMWGRMGRVNPTNFQRGNLFAHEYSIRSMTHYELHMGRSQDDGSPSPIGTTESEIFYWDFFESEFRVGGLSVTAEVNNLLAIP